MRTQWWVVGMFVVVALVIGRSSHAQGLDLSGPVIADVGFEFTIGDKVMPAGRYTIEVPEPGLVVFRPVKAKTVATAPVITRLAQSGHAPEDEARIVFDKIGDKYVAAEVWFPETDGYLIAGSKEPHTHHAVKIRRTT